MTTSLAEPPTETPTLAPLYANRALEAEVRDVMTSGVVSISDDATLKSALEAIEAHRVHAVLVVAGAPARRWAGSQSVDCSASWAPTR